MSCLNSSISFNNITEVNLLINIISEVLYISPKKDTFLSTVFTDCSVNNLLDSDNENIEPLETTEELPFWATLLSVVLVMYLFSAKR